MGERLRGVDKHTRSSGGLPGAADAWGIGECEYLIKNLSDAGVARNRKVNAGAGIGAIWNINADGDAQGAVSGHHYPLVTCECAVVALPPPCNYHKHGVEYPLCPAGGGNRR